MPTSYFEDLIFGGHDYLPACHAWIERRFDYFALNFCRSGRISWAMDGSEARLLNGPVAWWTVGKVDERIPPFYIYGALEKESWEHFYVTFSGPRATRMALSGLFAALPGEPHFCAVTEPESFAKGFFALRHALDRDGPQSPVAAHLLEGLFLELQTQAAPALSLSPLEVQVRQWLDSVRAAPQNHWDAEEQADILAVSYGHLRRLVNQITGSPPHRFVLDRRLDLAAAKLRGSSQPLKTLITECGFEDLPHFIRLFRRRYGVSPAAYRRETRLLR